MILSVCVKRDVGNRLQWKFQMLLQDEVKVASKLIVYGIIESVSVRHFSLQNQTT